MINMHYVYVLQSDQDNNLYVGCTNNLVKRVNQHNKGLNKSTKHRKPFNLIYYEKYYSKGVAFKREKYFKTAQGKRELKNKIVVSV